MISSCCSIGRSFDDLGVGERIGHALRVREVGAEHEVVDGDAEVDEALRVGLVEDVHPHVAVEHLDRVLVEQHARARRRRAAASGRRAGSTLDANSTGMNLSFGKRVARPWPMIDAIASTRLSFSDDSDQERRVDAAGVLGDAHLLVAETLPLVGVAVCSRGRPSACRRRGRAPAPAPRTGRTRAARTTCGPSTWAPARRG